MSKRNFVFVLLFASFFVSSPLAQAAMCGADNSGSCEFACKSGQGPISDPTNKCTGLSAGGTVCCSPASYTEWPSAQCYALGGTRGDNCDLIPNTFDAGAHLTADCNVSGRCCLPSGKFNNSNPLPAPQACNAQTCTSIGGQCLFSCTTGLGPGAGTCSESGKTCCIPGGGGACGSFGDGGECVGSTTQSCTSLNRVAAQGSCTVAGQSCCGKLISTESSLGRLNYTLLEEIPGQSGASGDLGSYLEGLYQFTFWAIGIAALFMLTIGGFMYVTSAGNTSRLGTAKTIIVDSFLGIIIALFAWLFLYVLNPDLVEGLRLPGLSTTIQTPTTTTTTTSTGLLTHAEAVAALSSGISIRSSGNCSDQSNPSCTSLEGIPSSAINSVNNLRTQSGCSLIITGGTETGHKTHGTGLGSIDFAEDTCLGNFLQNNITNYGSLRIQQICATPSWFSKVGATCTESSKAPHFHIRFAV